MAFPQPAGYYGLKLRPDVEEAIEALNYEQTVTLAHSITYHIGDGTGERFYCFIQFTPSSFDDAIDALTTDNKIALLRWLGDRLAYLQTVAVQEVK
ncbi:MAG: hypothetical protein ACKPCM_15315 [Pseudanabaena sp.]